jgi:hypothetical protein
LQLLSRIGRRDLVFVALRGLRVVHHGRRVVPPHNAIGGSLHLRGGAPRLVDVFGGEITLCNKIFNTFSVL